MSHPELLHGQGPAGEPSDDSISPATGWSSVLGDIGKNGRSPPRALEPGKDDQSVWSRPKGLSKTGVDPAKRPDCASAENDCEVEG